MIIIIFLLIPENNLTQSLTVIELYPSFCSASTSPCLSRASLSTNTPSQSHNTNFFVELNDVVDFVIDFNDVVFNDNNDDVGNNDNVYDNNDNTNIIIIDDNILKSSNDYQ